MHCGGIYSVRYGSLQGLIGHTLLRIPHIPCAYIQIQESNLERSVCLHRIPELPCD